MDIQKRCKKNWKTAILMLLVLGLLILPSCRAKTDIFFAPAAPKLTATFAPTFQPKPTSLSTLITIVPSPTTTLTPSSTPILTNSDSIAGKCLGSAVNAIVDLNCKEITIAVENAYPPFNYFLLSTGLPGGWDYDAWNEICTRLHCTPKYVEAAWEGLIQSVAEGQYDVGADGITITDDLKQIVDISMGYVKVDQRLLVRKGETRFMSMDDFIKNDKLILGTQTGTINEKTAARLLPEGRIKAFEQFPFAIQALISGDIDAAIMDETDNQGYLGENPDKVELVGPVISGDELGFIFPKGSTLVDPVNKALQAMNADNTLNTFNERYFGVNFKAIVPDIKQ